MLRHHHPTSKFSLQLQNSRFYFAFTKTINTVSYFSLLYLTWLFIDERLSWKLATACLVLSACWLVLTRIKLDHLFQTYFDILSRIELQLPMVLGVTLSSIAICARAGKGHSIIALAEICGWIYIFMLYRRNKHLFKQDGHGPVPADTILDPEEKLLAPGDLILTSGNVATQLHESVGHAETVIKMPDGRLMLFSSYMDKGARLGPIEELTHPAKERHYIALHLKRPWNKEEQDKAAAIAVEMVEANKIWAHEHNESSAKLIAKLPLPDSFKINLKQRLQQSGYDWFGTFMGRVATNHWTCIGACLELYRRMGIKTNNYGTGLFGFGTTVLDPIMPVRFLSDPAFVLLTSSNQQSQSKEA